MKKAAHSVAALCGVLAAIASAPALAQSPARALLDDTLVVNLGAFVLSSDVNAQLNGESVQNPEIDFDQAFGRDSDATRVRGDVLWRITPTHHLRFMYFDNTSKRSRVLDEAIKWGDYTFNPGSRTDFQYQLKVAELAYEYAFMREPDYEVAATIGVHVSDISLRLSGQASITDGDGNVSEVSGATKTGDMAAPLPVLGLRAGWVVAPQWYIDAQVQFFKVKYGDYDGNWSDFRLGATWMFSRHFGVGMGYNRFATRLNVGKDSFDGRIKTNYSGLQAYLTGAF